MVDVKMRRETESRLFAEGEDRWVPLGVVLIGLFPQLLRRISSYEDSVPRERKSAPIKQRLSHFSGSRKGRGRNSQRGSEGLILDTLEKSTCYGFFCTK